MDSGSGSRIAPGDGVVGKQAPRVCLGEAEPDERVLDASADALRVGEPAVELASLRLRRRHALEVEARDLLHEVDLAGHVARAPRRHAHGPVVADGEAETLETAALLGLLDLQAGDVALREAGLLGDCPRTGCGSAQTSA